MSAKLKNFERLAVRRVNEVIKKLHLIGNLANRNNYSYTDEHVKQVMDVVELEVKQLKGKFKGESAKDEVFSFRPSGNKKV